MFNLNTIFSRIMGIRAVQRQSIVSLIWQIALTFIGFLSTMYFAQTLGAGVLGAYFLFLAYFVTIGFATDGGFNEAAIKRISEGEETDAYFSAYFVLRSVFLIVVVLAFITFRGYFVDLNEGGTLIWLLLALIASVLYGSVSSGIKGCGKIGIYTTGNFINNISRIIVQVIAVFLGFEVAGLAGGFVVGLLVGFIVQVRFLDLRFARFGWRHIKSLSKFSMWVFLISSGMIVFSTADTIMIGYYLNNADVGVYRIVLQLTSLAAFTTTTLRLTLFPKVSRWSKTNETDLIEESLSRALTYSLILAVPIFVGGILLGDKMLYYFYGAEFAKGYNTMLVLFVVQIINVFQYLFTTYLIALDRPKKLFKIIVVAVAANVLLNVILIPVIGIIGAAVATLVTMGLFSVLAQRALSSIITIRVEFESLLNILKASVVMLLVVGGYRFLVSTSNMWLLLGAVMLGVITYVICVLKFDRKIYEELKGIMMQMNVMLVA